MADSYDPLSKARRLLAELEAQTKAEEEEEKVNCLRWVLWIAQNEGAYTDQVMQDLWEWLGRGPDGDRYAPDAETPPPGPWPWG
jgi:hypothetical protein